MRRVILAALLAALSFGILPAATRAEADVKVEIDRGSQTMVVIVDGVHRYSGAFRPAGRVMGRRRASSIHG